MPEWVQGAALPVDDADAEARRPERVLTEWDSELFGVGVHLRTITRDGWVCTAYLPGHGARRHARASSTTWPTIRSSRSTGGTIRPCASLRDDLLDDLWASQPPTHDPRLLLQAPV